MKKTLVWTITESAPDNLFVELAQIQASDWNSFLSLLKKAEKNGWVKIFGTARGEPEDVKSVIQEHFDTLEIKLGKHTKEKENGR